MSGSDHFIGRHRPTVHNLARPELRQNAAMDTNEEIVLAYVRRDVDREVAKAAAEALAPDSLRQFSMRLVEAVELLRQAATKANQLKGEKNRELVLELDRLHCPTLKGKSARH